MVQKFDSNGNFIIKCGSEGTGDAQFAETRAVAVDASGNVYVGDVFSYHIRVFAPSNQ
jgi:tripartite motif-containing protein 71